MSKTRKFPRVTKPGAGLVLAGFVLMVGCFALAGSAAAASHSWRFSEFYSSPDKTIQFIEMQEINGFESEVAIESHWYATNSYNQAHTELLGSQLAPGTANKKFLVGSVSYALLPGVPTPDYILPDGILEPSGATVVWWFYQTLTIPPATMPSDGVNSLSVIDPATPANGFSVGVNSPTNLAGETGSVVLPSALPAPGSLGWVYLLILGLSSFGVVTLFRRAEPMTR